MKNACAAFVLVAGLLSSCKNTGSSPDVSSALEPVGREAHKQDMAKTVAEARFKPGEQVTLRNTQVMVFDRNPQRYTAAGDVVAATNATVVMPEGLFVKVKFEDGKAGYISESDIIDPMENMGFGYGLDTSLMPAFISDTELPAPSSVMQNAADPAAVAPVEDKKNDVLPPPPAAPETKPAAPASKLEALPSPPSSSGANDALPLPSSKQ